MATLELHLTHNQEDFYAAILFDDIFSSARLDPAQPRLPMPAFGHFKLMLITSAYAKLDALTNSFDFTDATSAASQIDWASVPQ